MKISATRLVFLLGAFISILMLNGCARYARNVNVLYEPSVAIQSSAGDVAIVIPENQQTQSADMKWVIGDVTDGDNRKVDEVASSRSPAEIIQSAFAQELKKAGYTVTTGTKRHDSDQWVIDLTKSEIRLDQISEITKLKAMCRIVAGMNILSRGQLVKKLEYEASSSNIDIKDRDLLAEKVLEDALQTVMLNAVPDLGHLFKK